MYLREGWKSFIRAHSLGPGHVLLFKLIEADMISVKFFGASGARLGCCAESSSDSGSHSDTASLSDGDKEDSGRGLHRAKLERSDSD